MKSVKLLFSNDSEPLMICLIPNKFWKAVLNKIKQKINGVN